MAAVPLVDTDRLKTRLLIDPNLPIETDILEEAIIGAQAHLANMLGTDFQEGTVSDIFWLDPNRNAGIQPEGSYRLLLSKGFAVEVALTFGSAWNACDTPVPEGDIGINKERGFLYIDALKYGKKFVKVSYSYGLTPETTPDWVADALFVIAPELFNLPVATSDARGPKNAQAQINQMLANHYRALPMALRPMYTLDS